MSPFCETDLFQQWRKVRTQSKVLNRPPSDQTEVHVPSYCDLSPQVCCAISNILSRGAGTTKCKVKGQEWVCFGFTKDEEESLSHLASTLEASLTVGFLFSFFAFRMCFYCISL